MDLNRDEYTTYSVTEPRVRRNQTDNFSIAIQKQITLMEDLENRLTTIEMMQLAETGFTEWNDEEEDIYDV